jgi:hypothetical protein
MTVIAIEVRNETDRSHRFSRSVQENGRATRAGPTTIAAGVLWAHLMNCQGGNREKTDGSGIDGGIVDAGQADG